MDVKLVVALGFAIIFASVGDILLSVGMKMSGGIIVRNGHDLINAIRQALANPLVLLGVFSMALHFASYIAALAWVDVSVANPMTALSYLIVSLYALLVLKENVSLQRAAGISLVTVGAIFVGLSS